MVVEKIAEMAPTAQENKKLYLWIEKPMKQAKLTGMNGSLILAVPDWAGAVPGVNDKLDALAKNENLEFKRPHALKVWNRATFE